MFPSSCWRAALRSRSVRLRLLDKRDHRNGSSPQGGVTVGPNPTHGGYGGGGGSRYPSTTKVTTPPPTTGPGWHGDVRCHSASCFGKVD